MFQKAYDTALYNKCDINVRAAGLFEEGDIHKIVSHLIFPNNAVLQMQWVFIHCVLCNKNNCSFYKNIA
jgi:hypothetical protein